MTFLVKLSTALIFVATTTMASEPTLNPKAWTHQSLDHYEKLDQTPGYKRSPVSGKKQMVAGLLGARAMGAGFEALKVSGNAMDAALTSTLTEISLTGGRFISYAGIISVLYYDAKTGQTHHMSGGYNTVAGESDPRSITEGSGRAVLVPGFMAGIEAAHKKFGQLPFKTLFEPAIYFAENGIKVDSTLAKQITSNQNVLKTSEESKATFFKSDGTPLSQGDTLFQYELARTLRKVSLNGSQEMYTGAWAQKFVNEVQARGGHITLQDLKNYQALWTTPLRGSFEGHEIITAGAPDKGGAQLLEGLHILEHSKILDGIPDYTKSPKALAAMIETADLNHSLSKISGVMFAMFNDLEMSPEERITPEQAKKAWEYIKTKSGQSPPESPPADHSSSVVVTDKSGNIAIVEHSINAFTWGSLGLLVGGVSVPDSALIQRSEIGRVTPGERYPTVLHPTLIMKNGKPVAAIGTIGSALHEGSMQAIVKLLHEKRSAFDSVNGPMFHSYDPVGDNGFQVSPGEICDALLLEVNKLGTKVQSRADASPSFPVMIKKTKGGWEGAASTRFGIPSLVIGK